MTKRRSSATLGAFVLGALALAFGAIVAIGGGFLFHDTFQAIVYFDQSVVGLKVGAPVTFRGIQIGRVQKIRINLKHAVFDPSNVHIPVILELDAETMTEQGVLASDFDNRNELRMLVDQGLRAELATQSLVTGVRYIALDVRPGTPSALVADPAVTLPEIPSVPGSFQQLPEKVSHLLSQLERVDIEKLATDLDATLADTRDLLRSADLRRALRGVDELIANLDRTVVELRAIAKDVAPVTSAAERTAKSARTLFAPEGALATQLDATLREMRAAARSLRRLTEQISRDPGSLVRGGRP
ncbi:MAG: MlaD family protein [Kofleriaceae bacterium]|nr:MlaD family protein [Kofleriaceae bacterium]